MAPPAPVPAAHGECFGHASLTGSLGPSYEGGRDDSYSPDLSFADKAYTALVAGGPWQQSGRRP